MSISSLLVWVGIAVLSACEKKAPADSTSVSGPVAIVKQVNAGQIQTKPLAVTAKAGEKAGPVLTPGAPIENDEYKLRMAIPADMSAGKEAIVNVFLEPAAGWKLNREFPTALSLDPKEGVTVLKGSQSVGDAKKFEEKVGAEWAISLTSAKSGDVAMTGAFRFAVCTDATCKPKSVGLSFTLPVKP